ncbi:MAG: hypothetical protein Q7U07_05770 [Gammaproteobacteria bacterium]|nr:hypothetical protein [Gammaproteobacteria bacterium]
MLTRVPARMIAALLLATSIPTDAAEPDTANKAAEPTVREEKLVAGFAEGEKAQAAFDKMIRAYEAGDVLQLQSYLDPSMIGYQRLLDGARSDANAFKKLRIHLFNSRVMAGPDVAVIETNWEKRFLGVTDLQAGKHAGRSMVLMHRDKTGWKFAALAGDNLFAGASGSLASLSFSKQSAQNYTGVSTTAVEVLDQDMAGRRSIQVEFTVANGDREVFTLTETSLGKFGRTSLPSGNNAVVTNSGTLDFPPASLPTTLTMRYLDQNPGDGRPPSTLSKTISVTP